jgi:type II secretion system (T2SS) protein E
VRLGELLLQKGAVAPEQLEEALRTQQFFGARLGTNLVELGFVELDALTAALAEQMGLAGALRPHFDAIRPGAIALLPRKLAEKHVAIPLGLAKGNERQLVVAFREPRDIAGIDAVAFATGKRVTAAIAPELRMYYYLEKYYGIRRKSRYLRLQSNTAGTEAVRRPIPGSAIDVFAPPVAPQAPRVSGSVSVEPQPSPEPAPTLGPDVPDGDINIAAVLGDADTQRAAPQPSGRPIRQTGPVAVLPTAIDAGEASARIEAAQKRDEIGDALVGFLRSSFGCGLVLIAKDDMALGWKGFGPPGIDPTVVEGIALPLGSASMLKAAFETRGVFFGPPPYECAALQGRLWKLFKLPQPPAEVLVVPIMLKERVVNLVYAHALDGGAVPVEPANTLLNLCNAAATGYTRLIQRAKHKG